ncbi:MAG: hypothetical protein KJO43_10405, partial [Phycisphaerae bacterium]|nr:hypothetical protein [Phycisphaerae bacterium]
MNARLIQLVAAVVMVVCGTVCGRLLPPILEQTEKSGLRYTDVSVEGAPPFVALGTAIGALRGLIVDYLWIKVHIMKERGLFYEVMADAELITKLQPRFAAVWAFHGHNMAYNISVASPTEEDRWNWVNAGIRLVRNEGLRHNPNDLVLHKELAFWFAHKIEGYSDDAHLFYKRQFCREWHFVLGEPPLEQDEREAWIKAIADAPSSLEQAERRTPGVRALIERLDNSLTPFGESQRYAPTRDFLSVYGLWTAVRRQSAAAKVLGVERTMRAESPFFTAFDEIASDPEVQDAWATLMNFTRKRVLMDEYNMSPQLMYEYTRDLGPIDWRHGQAHALYWSRRGSQYGEPRVMNDDDIYKVINNDRLQVQAMQDLARYGRITFDPFSTELPSRFAEPRWIETIDQMFLELYDKHYDTRGAGGETFIAFLENFMSSAIREAFRSGEHQRAQALLDRLDEKFGRGMTPPNPKYSVPLDVFVMDQVKGEYTFQPHLAPSEAVASLRYAFREGIGRDRPEVYKEAVEFVDQVIAYFKGNEYNNYVTRFGSARMADLLADLETTRQRTFIQVMTDPTLGMGEK